MKNKLLVIAGPTASGKSSLAMKLAERRPIEIISGDSMQFYRGLDIGTAKPSEHERLTVRHHLIDTCDFPERVDVYKFITLAEVAAAEIRSRGAMPCVVGGTGMYLKALLYGLDDLPGDTTLRALLDEKYDHPDAFDELKAVMKLKDPAAYEKWNQHQRKLIRALEVFTLTGKSIVELQHGERTLKWDAQVAILNLDRDVLKERISARTVQMLNSGWIEETITAAKNGLFTSPTAHQALGYSIIAEFLNGTISRTELENRIAVKTWQFARRQLTWFRHQHPEARWFDMPQKEEDLFLFLEK